MDKKCPITKILSSISKKWTLLILRELSLNSAKRFNEIIKDLSPISPRTLSKQLKELEKLELISKTKFSEIPPRVEYSLTKKGKELIKCFNYIDTWVKKFNVK